MTTTVSWTALGRRDFFRLSALGALTAYVWSGPGRATAVTAVDAVVALPAAGIPQFATPLLVPPVMPRAGTMTMRRGQNADLYRIAVRQFQQQILPVGLPRTTVWGYGPVDAAGGTSGIFNAPSLTVEAQWRRPVVVKWVNQLVDGQGRYLPHLLPVDPTLHWANPPGGPTGRDSRPTFTQTPDRYTGPVPIVTHVHGMADVRDDSDGYAEAWFLPAATDLPAGYATTGTWYDFFGAKAKAGYGVDWAPGSATFAYPNTQRASTAWFHDHTLGMTRLNVYAGPAGFWIVRGGPEGDKAVLDARTGKAAGLPGPAPKAGDKGNKAYREIPLAIQDRAFAPDGSLFYPDSRAYFDGIEGPYVPGTDVSPIWNPEFFGNTIIVNGATWPFLAVERRRYRFRLLNGCQARWLLLDFSAVPRVDVWQIGNEGGFLPATVHHTDGRLQLSPAERADVIIDFTAVPEGRYVLGNLGPDEPFGGGVPDVDFAPADPATTGRVLEFRVVAATSVDTTTPPQFLTLPAIAPLPAATVTRRLALLEHMSTYFEDGPTEALLGSIDGDPSAAPKPWHHAKWADPVTENPAPGTSEIWEFYNTTADAHPMHIHEVLFEVVDRQGIVVDEEEMTVALDAAAPARPPEPRERGFKDTVTAYPGEVTRVRALFDTPGQYVWHCHIVEHEDNEMMRPYRVGPVQPGQPAATA